MKKSKFFSYLLSREITQNRRQYVLMFGIFFAGLLAGTLSAALSDTVSEIQEYVDSFLSSYSMQGTAKSQVFSLAMLNYLKFAFFLWVSGWYPWLFPLCFLQVFSKGFRTGFVIASFVQCYYMRGVLLSFLTLLPQNLLFLPSLFFFAVYQFRFLSDRRFLLAGNGNHSFQKQVYGKNIIFCFFFLLLLAFCALIEGYVIPSLLQPFCGFFLQS